MPDTASYDDFLSAFGISNDDVSSSNSNTDESAAADVSVETAPAEDSSINEDTTSNNSGDNANPDAQNNNDDEEASAKQAQQIRTNNAFAQMRVENTKMRNMLHNVAGILGIDANATPEQIEQNLQQAIINAQAKQQNINPELLTRLNQLEDYKQQAEQTSLNNQAMMGFQAVKNQFNLTDKELGEFADQLIKSNVNPFAQRVDLMSEYKLRNFDALIEKATQRGIEQEAKRQGTVGAHSTKPGQSSGSAGDNTSKINSVAELSKWFAENDTNN